AHALEGVAAAAELLDDAHPLRGDEAGAEEVDHGAAAARSRRGLQHGDVMIGGELVGEGEAGDAAPDDRDIHAPDATGTAGSGVRRFGGRRGAVVEGVTAIVLHEQPGQHGDDEYDPAHDHV